MDKDVVQIDYETGVRAYLINGEMMFKTSLGVVPFDSIDPFNQGRDHFYSRWHALRAYQDAERKKGVPITVSDVLGFLELRYQHIDENGNGTLNIPVFSGTFIMYQSFTLSYYVDEGYIGHCAKFTNFRWRAGYPKGGQNG